MPNFENNIPTTYPNQRTIKIHREVAKSDFLGIKNSNWMAASRNLRPHALLLYLYLAANADNYNLALSPAAIRQDIGMARSTFHDQFHVLVDKGYLVHSHGNTFDFYEVPQTRDDNHNECSELADGLNFESGTASDNGITDVVKDIPQVITEINNNKNCNNYVDDKYTETSQPKVEVVYIQPPVAKGKKQQVHTELTKAKVGEFVF